LFSLELRANPVILRLTLFGFAGEREGKLPTCQ
jgi:hypothetical protein